MDSQATIGRAVEVEGIGLHTGRPVRCRLLPAPPGHGIVFARTDLPGAPAVRASWRHVADTTLATTLADGAARVATVEHLLAALLGAWIDNVRVEVEGPEIPILDGSAGPWMELLRRADRARQQAPARRLVVRRRVEVVNGDRRVLLEPADALVLQVAIDFPHPLVGRQETEAVLEDGVFGRAYAWARTFAFLEDVEQMRAAGLARGGSLDNAVVYGPAGPLNPGGVRSPDEPVRHKLLDLVGDLALLGHRPRGRLVAERPGHGLTLALLQTLMADPEAWTLEG